MTRFCLEWERSSPQRKERKAMVLTQGYTRIGYCKRFHDSETADGLQRHLNPVLRFQQSIVGNKSKSERMHMFIFARG